MRREHAAGRTAPSTALLGRIALPLIVVVAACSTPDRSRDLADPATPAQALATQVCSNCHGYDGNATSPNFPNLAGQPADYLVAQMTGFRDRKRSDPAGFEYMWGLSRHLTDGQIKGLAAYYAGRTPVVLPPGGEAARVAAGKAIFEAGLPAKGVPPCGGCHGAKGEGMAAFPRLAGQHADYVVKQLQVFQRTDERPEGSVMKEVAHGLRPEDMEAVAAYVQGMPVRP